MDAAFKRLTVIKKTEKDPALYDVVAIGTPVWANKMSTPARTYLFQNKDRFGRVAFFLTRGGTENEKVLMGMAEVRQTASCHSCSYERGSDDWPIRFKS